MSLHEISFTNIKQDELINLILDVPRSSSIIVTPNLDFLMRYMNKDNIAFNSVLQNADYCVCDSRILYLLGKIKGTYVPDVITGSDLTKNIIERLQAYNRNTFFIGPNKVDISKVVKAYKLNNVYSDCPPFGFEKDEAYIDKMIESLEKANPSIIFLALGSPKQELLAQKLKENNKLKSHILCIGASIDFLSGKAKRAPKIISHLYLEWLFRWLSEPKRLTKRYVSNALFLCRILFNTNSLRKK